MRNYITLVAEERKSKKKRAKALTRRKASAQLSSASGKQAAKATSGFRRNSPMRKKRRTAKQKRATARMLAAARRKRRHAKAAAAPRRRHRRRRARAVASAPRRRRYRRRAHAPKAAAKRHRRRKHRRARQAAAPRRHKRRRRAREQGELFGGDWTQFKPGETKVKKRRRGRRRKYKSTAARLHARGHKFRRIKIRRGRMAGKTIRRKLRRHWVPGHSRKGKHVKGHYSFERSARSNPADLGELVTIGVLGGIGALISLGADRFVATHAVGVDQDGKALPAPTNGVYIDQPGKGQDYDQRAVNAPIWSSLLRLGVGVVLAAGPVLISAKVRPGMGRAALYGFGVGAGIRFTTKLFTDVVAMAMAKNAWGQRLFAPEISAANASKALKADMQNPPTDALTVGFSGVKSLGMGAASPCGCKDKGWVYRETYEMPPPPSAIMDNMPPAGGTPAAPPMKEQPVATPAAGPTPPTVPTRTNVVSLPNLRQLASKDGSSAR